jgi:hypothetical protein
MTEAEFFYDMNLDLTKIDGTIAEKILIQHELIEVNQRLLDLQRAALEKINKAPSNMTDKGRKTIIVILATLRGLGQ